MDAGDSSEQVASFGAFGFLDIHGDVRGGSGDLSGAVAGTHSTTTTIGGAVIFGTSTDSGTVT